MEIKHYDNSRLGNNCLITEHWYLIPEPKCVIKVLEVRGWYARGIETTTYTEVSDSMPEEVKGWFE